MYHKRRPVTAIHTYIRTYVQYMYVYTYTYIIYVCVTTQSHVHTSMRAENWTASATYNIIQCAYIRTWRNFNKELWNKALIHAARYVQGTYLTYVHTYVRMLSTMTRKVCSQHVRTYVRMYVRTWSYETLNHHMYTLLGYNVALPRTNLAHQMFCSFAQ